MSHREGALMRYCDGLMDLVTRIVAAIPEHPACLALAKVAHQGLDDLKPMLAQINADRVETLRSGRGSGRTHRMLVEAVTQAREGRTVLVLVADAIQVKDFETRIAAFTDSPDVRWRISVRPYTVLEIGGLTGQRYRSIFEDHAVAERRASHWEALKRSLTS